MLTLAQILGQDHAISMLCDAMASGRVHHAWIFHGPAGVGKCTTAMALAATLLDPTSRRRDAGTFEPDPASPVQRLIRAGSHPDLHVISKELASFSRDRETRQRKQTVIPIDVVREFLVEPASRTGHGIAAQTGRSAMASKVLIVDEAHLLNLTGQNAVLKTLEEPAPGTVIILVTSNEDRLLATVRSRCQRVAFRPLDEHALDSWLDGARVDRPLPAWLIAFASGSPGAVVTAIEGDLASWHRTLEPLLAQAERGRHCAEFAPQVAQLVETWATRFVESRPSASKDAANKAGADQMLRFLAQHTRGRLHEALDQNASAEPWLSWLDAIALAEQRIGANVRLPFAMEELSARWVDAARA